ncbi:MAG: hypothetical protein LIO69_09470, partial [Oscillospiraceae bacterium]|nr:hypothetical protein [Oscillospiraceae bacterium]
VYLYYTTLSNKRGALHFWGVFYFCRKDAALSENTEFILICGQFQHFAQKYFSGKILFIAVVTKQKVNI